MNTSSAEDEDVDLSEIAELGADFFETAILVRSGENLIDQVQKIRERSGSDRVS